MRSALEAPNRALHVGYTYSWMSSMRARRPEQREGTIGDKRFASGAIRHVPVMVAEVLADLNLKPGAVVLDGTLGLGGHSLRMIDLIRPGGTLVGLDWDAEMLEIARENVGKPEGVAIHLKREDFRNAKDVLEAISLKADAILLDLGLNTAQVLDSKRGFSFAQPGPLDSRMDKSRGEPASAVLNRMSPGEIESMLLDFGDERWARAIARRIVDHRKTSPLKTTQDLVECVLEAVPPRARDKRIHPATRTFQAVRIFVNRELDGLDRALFDAAECLASGGTLAVLSYHSGEDRIVKRTFRELVAEGFAELHKKPLEPGLDEVRRNPRARSAKLRSLRKPVDFQGRKSNLRKDIDS